MVNDDLRYEHRQHDVHDEAQQRYGAHHYVMVFQGRLMQETCLFAQFCRELLLRLNFLHQFFNFNIIIGNMANLIIVFLFLLSVCSENICHI